MFEELVFEKLWIVLPVWLVLYISDYFLTILGARYLKAGAQDHFVFEGSYEMTPQFQADIDALRIFSRRFFGAATVSTAIIVFLWYISRQDRSGMFLFKFLIGGLILREVAIHIRHARNITMFRFARNHQGISGQIAYRKWVSYRISSVEMTGFSFLFLIAFLLSGSVPFLGGSFTTAYVAFQNGWLSRKKAQQ